MSLPFTPAGRSAWRRRGPSFAALLLVAACQAQPAAPSAETALLARIRGEIGEARCSGDAQCRTLGVGAKPCGGPEAWLAWSTAGADAAGRADRLQAWSAELAALQRRRHESSGMVSNCQYNADPGASCQAQRCVLRSAATAS